MNILWFTWKDADHPLAGGAEKVNEELAKRLVRDGHRVVFVVGGFDGGEEKEKRDGFKIVRVGNRYTVYWKAYRYYKKHLSNESFDIVIDEINTIPFFASQYIRTSSPSDEGEVPEGGRGRDVKNPKHFLFVHQLCREIWFHQMPFPLSIVGYILEPFYLRLLKNIPAIVVSQSTKQDLIRHGYRKENIHIISEGSDMEPVSSLRGVFDEAIQNASRPEDSLDRRAEPRDDKKKDILRNGSEKYSQPTLLSLGAIRSMKQTIDQLRAFEIAKKNIPNLRFLIAGDAQDAYGKKFIAQVEQSPYKKDIEYLGRVSGEKKKEIMQKSHVIAVTSVKEGWGLIVTEANSQGTPAVAYDADGLRDSVRDSETGLLARENTPEALAEKIVELLKDPQEYERLRKNAWEWSKTLTFERSYEDFVKILQEIYEKLA